jgi:hypothetical protein
MAACDTRARVASKVSMNGLPSAIVEVVEADASRRAECHTFRGALGFPSLLGNFSLVGRKSVVAS